MPLSGWLRAIVENVAQVPATIGTMHLAPRHPDLVIGRIGDRATVHRLPEAGPSSAAFELRGGGIQRVAAPRADEGAASLLVIEWRAIRALGTGLPQHAEFFCCQALAPLTFGIGDAKIAGAGGSGTAGAQYGRRNTEPKPAQQASAIETFVQVVGHGPQPMRAGPNLS